MARRVVTVLEDDIDGGDATETVTFALDGIGYEIDLNDENAAGLRDALAPYVGAARAVSGTRTRPRRRAAAAPRAESRTAEIRSWARENGYEVSERGRIPGNVVAAFEAAHA